MELECYREGRYGFHIGDVIEVPDDVDAFDSMTFKVREKPADPDGEASAEATKEAEIAKLEAQIAEAEANTADQE